MSHLPTIQRAGFGALLLVLNLASLAAEPPSRTEPPAGGPPPSRIEAVRDVYHGVEVSDPYRWLEDQESTETRAWIEAQNAYTSRQLAAAPNRDELRRRVAELLRVERSSLPTERAGRLFFERRRAGDDLRVVFLREADGGPDQVLLDPHGASADHSVSYELNEVSDDGKLLVYGERQGGKDEASLRFFAVDERRTLADGLPEALYNDVELSPDGKVLYYTLQTPEGPRLRRHRLGQAAAADDELFGAGYGRDKILYPLLSGSGRFLVVTVLHGAGADQTDVYVQDLAAGTAFRPVVEGVAARFEPTFAGDRLLLHTNWLAPNGRVLAVDLAAADLPRVELVPESQEAVIHFFGAVAGRLFVIRLQDVQSRLTIYDLAGQRLSEVAFDGVGSMFGFGGSWTSKHAYYSFTSFVQPSTIYRHDPASGERTVWAKSEVPFDGQPYEVKQIWFGSQDGTRVPMFVVHRKGLALDGTHPTMLYAYGGFAVSLTPRFDAQAALWVERGGVYAVANIRGGGEFGEPWHLAGMLEKRQNAFDDFAAAAETLIRLGYTKSEKLAVSGVSNGGLLVATLAMQRPELVKAVVCGYPLLDMLRYHRFLLGPYWVSEYGSADAPALFPALYAYSPYHHVVPRQRYPAMLFITGDADTRVAPLHARKMVARLQAEPAAGNLVLLRYHIQSGHSGGEPVSVQIENLAETVGFVAWQLGL